ncbi:Prefoldin subunit-domain-containing protein [Hypoxylon fragiforme]|uniref:Prefoldin subunit-domain-containing protein n=1 Tax=Hypoxylon fragiforme TaxID=63214 RepID=UPI0020C61FBE|nr:Prefoldin subunit-domain-containing protein [Hypoxylon fragiforme]KAI2604455.1 Prefoldin subunit-domain-containing protein [Hypoxylon fragiforme]
MTSVKDSFIDLERHRQLLQENVDKLSKALDHWKQWRKEYDALRIDIKSLPSSASKQELTSVRKIFKGDLLNEKELVDIFGRDDSKKVEQIVSTLSNRLDYVGKNINTLTKQLEESENKLAAVTVITNPDATDEEGLPITEILEELDDDDNIVSFSLRRPGDSQPQILEALQKAGITDFSSAPDISEVPEASQESSNSEPKASKDAPSPSSQPPNESRSDALSSHSLDSSAQQHNEPEVQDKPQGKPTTKKKSVTFSEDTKPDTPQEQSETAKRLEEILQKAKDQQSIISDPILPADESPEDAELREDMIRYNKQTMEYEMAPIVAELQLEEGSSGDDTDNYSDYDDDDDDSDEDQWGKSKLKVDDEWKLEMLELKKRLSSQAFGKTRATDDEDELTEGIGRITIQREGSDVSNGEATSHPTTEPQVEDSPPPQSTKKSVRFAPSLDIAEDSPTTTSIPVMPMHPEHSEVDPVSDIVMERNAAAPRPVPASTKKASRFKKGRATDSPVSTKVPSFNGIPIAPEKPENYVKAVPTGPDGRTLADAVLEHEPSSEAKSPDELDATLLHQQVTEEYHKMRNKFVHRQGGFMKENEDPIQPLDEEEGGPRRMSRFKAARLAKS